MSTFLEGVNRLFRKEGVIGIDDSDITSFSSTQHAATLELAKQAIQDEITYLTTNHILDVERSDATITTAAGTRTYALASDFLQFTDERPWLVEVDVSNNSENTYITEYPGGENALKYHAMDYRETQSTPQHWYYVRGSTKKLGFWPVPDAVKYYRYYYEASNQVSVSSDTLPTANTDEFNALMTVCARRFKYLSASPQVRDALFPVGLEVDAQIEAARAVLISLLQYKKTPRGYGRRYA